MNTFLDSHYADQVRLVASRWLVDDGATCDQVEFQSEIAELRAAFERNRLDCLSSLMGAVDEAGVP